MIAATRIATEAEARMVGLLGVEVQAIAQATKNLMLMPRSARPGGWAAPAY
jgi:hypothetical protein